jgi:hypothetical protein
MLTEVTLPDTFTSAGLSDKGNKWVYFSRGEHSPDWVAFSDAGKKRQISVNILRFEKGVR